jgi:hypothetical protein
MRIVTELTILVPIAIVMAVRMYHTRHIGWQEVRSKLGQECKQYMDDIFEILVAAEKVVGAKHPYLRKIADNYFCANNWLYGARSPLQEEPYVSSYFENAIAGINETSAMVTELLDIILTTNSSLAEKGEKIKEAGTRINKLITEYQVAATKRNRFAVITFRERVHKIKETITTAEKLSNKLELRFS